jgi:hypothetical protein
MKDIKLKLRSHDVSAENDSQKKEEPNVYAQARAKNDIKQAGVASRERWEHPAIRKAGTTHGEQDNGVSRNLGIRVD